MTSKEYMHCVTTVDPYWLAEMGPMFFSIKEQGENRMNRLESEKRTEREIEKQIEKAKKEQQIKKDLDQKKQQIE
jgi:pre-mRNA-splicing factor ATP-dependent RNA helicase DHX38/PRP16